MNRGRSREPSHGDKMAEFYQKVELLDASGLLTNPLLKAAAWMTHRDRDYDFFDKMINDTQAIEHALTKLHHEKLNQSRNPFYPPPSGESFSGPIPLGVINSRGDFFKKAPENFKNHILIPGSSGTGKSRLIFFLLLTAYHYFNVIIFDRKREYRAIQNLVPNVYHVIKFNKLAMNPLEVHVNANLRQNLNSTLENFCSINKLLTFSKNILIEEVSNLYKKLGMFDGATMNFPTIEMLLEKLRSRGAQGTREKEAISSLINRLVHYRDLGVCSYQRGFDNKSLFDHNAIIELDGTTDEDYCTFTSNPIHRIFRWRMENNERDFTFRKPNLIICDEARRLFPNLSGGDPAFGNASLTDLYAISREFGINWILLTQEPSSLNNTILSNTGTQIMFQLSSGQERMKMARNMGLTDDMIKQLSKLPPQQVAVVKTFSYPKPFILFIPNIRVEKNISDEQLENDFNNRFIESLGARREIFKGQETPTPQAKVELSPEAQYLLYFISMDQFKSIKTLYAEARLSAYKGNRIKEELIEKFFVKEESLNLGKARPRIYLALEQKAYALLKIKPPQGKGNFIHKLICHKAKDFFEAQGFKTQLEKDQIDLVISKDSEKIAVEITISFSNLSSNVIRDINIGFKTIELVFINPKDLEKGKELLSRELGLQWAAFADRVRFSLAEKYLAPIISPPQNKPPSGAQHANTQE